MARPRSPRAIARYDPADANSPSSGQLISRDLADASAGAVRALKGRNPCAPWSQFDSCSQFSALP
jgi:hypothetical protein